MGFGQFNFQNISFLKHLNAHAYLELCRPKAILVSIHVEWAKVCAQTDVAIISIIGINQAGPLCSTLIVASQQKPVNKELFLCQDFRKVLSLLD